MVGYTVSFPEELNKRMVARVNERGVSVADYIRMLVKANLEDREK